MKGKILKKILAAALVLTLVSGAVPIPPVADMFGDMVITANASPGDLTNFLTVSSSGTATGYFTFENHFYKVDWFGINTTETTSVLFHYSSTYDDLEAERNGNTKDSILLSPIAETSTSRWNASYIKDLTPGQHSDGYTTSHDLSINADTEGEKSAKVCTITCMAANAPTWSWSADHSTYTATFTCTEDPSLTATVNAAVTEANHIRIVSAVFNGINYSDSMLIPEQDGSTYIIQNETGWDLFCDLLANSDKGFFDGKTVKLDADITIKKSAGSSGHGFTGTFDGQEYTLTVADNYSYAPFCYVDNGCVIEKLHTDGIVRAVVSGTSRTNASGLIDTLTGNVTVRNCCSSVMIHDSNTTRHEGKHGGLVGKTDSGSSVTIEGCIFDGKMATIIPDYTTDCAGFVGEANGSVNIKNSIYDPDTLLQQDGAAISDSGSATFVRGGSATMTNCYYTRTLGTAQGKQAHTITADENVTIDYGTATDIYSVITAYGTGLAYNDNFYAGEGDEVTLTLDNIPPTGYKLKNYTVDHGTLNGNILTMPNESVKAGAVFDPITYTVAFDKNHSDASGTMNAQHFTYNESRNLTENGFTAPKDYRFAGWATSPDGTAEYGNGAEVKNLTAADGTTVTLYAKWETPNYSILKNSTHGTITAKVGETENALTAHYNDTVILTVQPDAGYWLKKLIVMDADGNEVPVNDNKFTMPDGDVTVSAAFDNSDECAFDEETGTLYLRGNVDKSDVQQYKDKAVYVVAEEGTVLPEDCGAMFDTFKKVQSIDLKKADTSAVTNMSSMFTNCSGLTDLDVSSFDTSAVTDMSDMFNSCEKLANLDISSFDTSNVHIMTFMFANCSGLTTIYVSYNWNIQASCASEEMFSGCVELVGGNQTRWDDNYTDAYYAVIDGKDGQHGYLTSAENLYALRLPDNMEIVSVMPSENKVGGRYLCGTDVSFKAKEYYNASNVKANEIPLNEENGIYHILVICDTIVTAELEEQTFTVTFNSSGGTAVESQTVAYNKMANEPETPSKELCTFDGWYIGDTKFDFRTPITSDIDLTAHWTEKTVDIKFKGVSGSAVKTLQIHTKNGSFADVSEQIEIPSASYLDGYTFTGWTLNGTKYNTDQQDSLITALADLAAQNGATDNDIIVNEVYEQKDDQFTVEVKNGIIRNGGPTGTFKPSDEVYVTAAGGSEGQQFSYWTKKAKNSEISPVIVSYEENYVFRMPSSDTELQAVYGELLPYGKVGTAYIESVTKTGDNMVSFVSILSVPDDATMLKAGIVACKASDLKYGHDAPDINYARFRKYNETTCKDYKAFKYTWTKSNIDDGDVWCVRAYLLYSDKDGVQHDVYGEMVKADKNGKVEEIS